MEKYKSVYPTLRQAKTKWSKPSIVAKQGEGPSHGWYEMLKKDARAKLASSIYQSHSGSVHKQERIVREDKIGKPTPSVEEIAKKHNISVDQVNAQIKKGIEVEKEHTADEGMAHEIARDHLGEFPDYYDRLGAMEKAAKKAQVKEGYDPEKEILRNRIEAHKALEQKMAKHHGAQSQEAAFHRALVKRWEKELKENLKEEVANSVGGGMSPVIGGEGNIHGFDPIMGQKPVRRRKFAGKQVFVVDPTTYHKAYLGKRKYEHYEKYLEGSPFAEEIRAYGRKYWDEPIILENEQTGAMVYLKYGSK